MQSPVVHFLHHEPPVFNVGDHLCSPKHYFDFSGNQEAVAIVGGGVFSDFGYRKVREVGLPLSKAILWGAGRSVKRNSEGLDLIEKLDYCAWGLRDIDGVAIKDDFLPCVSCLHPMLDQPLPKVEKTLLFLNADARVTSRKARKWAEDWANGGQDFLLFNDIAPEVFVEHLKVCSHIVTNSFHGAYWGLLSGRSVNIVGYSTKFTSLLKTLGLSDGAMQRYEKPRKNSFLDLFKIPREDQLVSQLEYSVASKNAWCVLEDAALTRNHFRALNLSFAAHLVELGIFKEVSLKLNLFNGHDVQFFE